MDYLVKLPLDEALEVGVNLMKNEEKSIAAASALLEKINMMDSMCILESEHNSNSDTNNIGEAARKVMKAIARCIGEHPAIGEQVISYLSISSFPKIIIEMLPHFIGSDEDLIKKTVEEYKQLINSDTNLLVPILGSLFDLPLKGKLRREILLLAKDSLSIVDEQEVPVVVRTLLKLLDDPCECSFSNALNVAIINAIRCESAYISNETRVILIEVLSQTLPVNAYSSKLYLCILRQLTCQPAIDKDSDAFQFQDNNNNMNIGVDNINSIQLLDTVVLTLLFQFSQHRKVVEQILLGSLQFGRLPFEHFYEICDNIASNCETGKIIIEPLVDMLMWILFCSSQEIIEKSQTKKKYFHMEDTTIQYTIRMAGKVILQVFEDHEGFRNQILSFLFRICTCVRQRRISDDNEGHNMHLYNNDIKSRNGNKKTDTFTKNTDYDSFHQIVASDLILSLCQNFPGLIVSYSSLLCENILYSISNVSLSVMNKLLHGIAIVCGHPRSNLESNLIIYIQKQLLSSNSNRTGSLDIFASTDVVEIQKEQDIFSEDEKRQLGSVILFTMLISYGGVSKEDGQRVLSWVLRALPTCNPLVTAYGMAMLLGIATNVFELNTFNDDTNDDDDYGSGSGEITHAGRDSSLFAMLCEFLGELNIIQKLEDMYVDLDDYDDGDYYDHAQNRICYNFCYLVDTKSLKSNSKRGADITLQFYEDVLGIKYSDISDYGKSDSNRLTYVVKDFVKLIRFDDSVESQNNNEYTTKQAVVLIRKTWNCILVALEKLSNNNSNEILKTLEVFMDAAFVLPPWYDLDSGEWILDFEIWNETTITTEAKLKLRTMKEDNSFDHQGVKLWLELGWNCLLGSIICSIIVNKYYAIHKEMEILPFKLFREVVKILDLRARCKKCIFRCKEEMMKFKGKNSSSSYYLTKLKMDKEKEIEILNLSIDKLAKSFEENALHLLPQKLLSLAVSSCRFIKGIQGTRNCYYTLHEYDPKKIDEEFNNRLKNNNNNNNNNNSSNNNSNNNTNNDNNNNSENNCNDDDDIECGNGDKDVCGEDFLVEDKNIYSIFEFINYSALLLENLVLHYIYPINNYNIVDNIFSKECDVDNNNNNNNNDNNNDNNNNNKTSSSSDSVSSATILSICENDNNPVINLDFVAYIVAHIESLLKFHSKLRKEAKTTTKSKNNSNYYSKFNYESVYKLLSMSLEVVQQVLRKNVESGKRNTINKSVIYIARKVYTIRNNNNGIDTNLNRNDNAHVYLEYFFDLFAKASKNIEDEFIACQLLEIMVILTKGTNKASTSTCLEAFKCLKAVYLTKGGRIQLRGFDHLYLNSSSNSVPYAFSILINKNSFLKLNVIPSRQVAEVNKIFQNARSPRFAQLSGVRHFLVTYWSLLSPCKRIAALEDMLEISKLVIKQYINEKKLSEDELKKSETIKDLNVNNASGFIEIIFSLAVASFNLGEPVIHSVNNSKNEIETNKSPYYLIDENTLFLTKLITLIAEFGNVQYCSRDNTNYDDDDIIPKRLFVVVVRIGSQLLKAIAFQINRCIEWRSQCQIDKGDNTTDDNNKDDDKRGKNTMESEFDLQYTSTDHLQNLFMSFLGLCSVINNFCEIIRSYAASESFEDDNNSVFHLQNNNNNNNIKNKRQKRKRKSPQNNKYNDILSDIKTYIPRIIFQTENVTDLVRESCSILHISFQECLKKQFDFQSFKKTIIAGKILEESKNKSVLFSGKKKQKKNSKVKKKNDLNKTGKNDDEYEDDDNNINDSDNNNHRDIYNCSNGDNDNNSDWMYTNNDYSDEVIVEESKEDSDDDDEAINTYDGFGVIFHKNSENVSMELNNEEKSTVEWWAEEVEESPPSTTTHSTGKENHDTTTSSTTINEVTADNDFTIGGHQTIVVNLKKGRKK